MRIFFLLIPVYFFFLSFFENLNAKEKKYFFLDYGFDPYYSSVGVVYSFLGKDILTIDETEEQDLYKNLVSRAFLPNFLLFEVSVNPLPVAGVGIRKYAYETYQRSEITDSFNLVKTITAGFEEPYALSLFIGNIAQFRRTGEEAIARNIGYMGYLVSYGNYHIKDNVLIPDHWVEIEWKIKGERIFSKSLHNWSFRFGTKIHSHPNIADVFYISMRRNRIDFLASRWGILANSGFEYIFDFSLNEGSWMRHFFLAEKNFPYQDPFVFILGIGFNYEANRKYTGPLADRRPLQNFQFLIRPNIRF